jgi:hypothetical protein
MAESWRLYVMQIPRVSERIALAITRVYPSFRRLWQAYAQCAQEKQREGLVQVSDDGPHLMATRALVRCSHASALCCCPFCLSPLRIYLCMPLRLSSRVVVSYASVPRSVRRCIKPSGCRIRPFSRTPPTTVNKRRRTATRTHDESRLGTSSFRNHTGEDAIQGNFTIDRPVPPWQALVTMSGSRAGEGTTTPSLLSRIGDSFRVGVQRCGGDLLACGSCRRRPPSSSALFGCPRVSSVCLLNSSSLSCVRVDLSLRRRLSSSPLLPLPICFRRPGVESVSPSAEDRK